MRAAISVSSSPPAIFNWYEKRNEDYRSPIVRGMCRYSSKASARDRILTDAEIRKLWGASGLYADMLKLLLLTGQRRDKVASIRREDLKNGAWTIATEAREKNNAGVLDLPGAALDIIRRQPRSNGYVFPGARGGHFANFKARANIHQGSWVVHDLRRTARSLMSRAGVRPDIAERVLGHAISGVEAIYDSTRLPRREGRSS